jgi:hypothetical protein
LPACPLATLSNCFLLSNIWVDQFVWFQRDEKEKGQRNLRQLGIIVDAIKGRVKLGKVQRTLLSQLPPVAVTELRAIEFSNEDFPCIGFRTFLIISNTKNVIVFIYILALHNNEQIELVQFVS